MVLRVGEFETIGVQTSGQSQQCRDGGQVSSVEHTVERQRKPELVCLFAERNLLLETLRSGDLIGSLGLGVLDRDLDAAQAEAREPLESDRIERQAGGHQMRIEIGCDCTLEDLFEIATRRGFAAGESDMNDTQGGGFFEDASPILC